MRILRALPLFLAAVAVGCGTGPTMPPMKTPDKAATAPAAEKTPDITATAPAGENARQNRDGPGGGKADQSSSTTSPLSGRADRPRRHGSDLGQPRRRAAHRHQHHQTQGLRLRRPRHRSDVFPRLHGAGGIRVFLCRSSAYDRSHHRQVNPFLKENRNG